KDLPKDFKEDDLVNCGTAYTTKNCFIATACYGSPLAPEVETLRRFRDGILARSGLGRLFIAVYYALSPAAAQWLEAHPIARTFVRTALIAPLVVLVHRFRLDRRHAQRSGRIGGS